MDNELLKELIIAVSILSTDTLTTEQAAFHLGYTEEAFMRLCGNNAFDRETMFKSPDNSTMYFSKGGLERWKREKSERGMPRASLI